MGTCVLIVFFILNPCLEWDQPDLTAFTWEQNPQIYVGQPTFPLWLMWEVWIYYSLLAQGDGLWPGPSQSELCVPWPQWNSEKGTDLRLGHETWDSAAMI